MRKLIFNLNKLHRLAPICLNCGAFTEWGRLCWNCVRAALIGAATGGGASLAAWWWGK